ncbi:ribosomal protein L1-like protein [Lasiosphaeria miniovina]|uniref:Ribosomal protein L1-like protein n=1 Tax=Lasiosphaeria miniovina TaxID=1954250 RepID=A0AA40B525_9PEZI|nr:ribosomal protein L1-like protein [Lasiosphaeria miniovina]KAK0727816.1 ribosomal protein L1-like protein [Lasiosphaeria miniovina]
MASTTQCLASLARLSLRAPARPMAISTIPNFLLPSVATPLVRYASKKSSGGNNNMRKRVVKKKKAYKTFRSYDMTNMDQYSLCDAMRYLRAFEVGSPPTSVKYEVAVKLKTQKNGPVLRNRIRLPFPVKTDTRIAVICPEDSPLALEAQQLGAVAVGEESLFEAIRQGNIQFNKLICHKESEAALKKANVGKLLGPKGLMPSAKTKTLTTDLKGTMQEMIGADEFRERNGVVRLAIGQLGFTPQMLSDNLKAFMGQVKTDMNQIDDSHVKLLDEVVLSSTSGPGFSLNGKFNPSGESLEIGDLESVM